jgi:hypothetical protein
MNNTNILQEVTSKPTTNEQHKHCSLVVGFDVTSCKMFVLFIGGGF